jgi:hypothetical protein
MLMKKWSSYWLVLLIVMQSITAFADTTQAHQSEDVQTPTEITQPQLFEKSTQFFNDGLDCHSYCYCHLYLSDLPTFSFDSLSSLRTLVLNGYRNTTLSGSRSSVFRPPKV